MEHNQRIANDPEYAKEFASQRRSFGVTEMNIPPLVPVNGVVTEFVSKQSFPWTVDSDKQQVAVGLCVYRYFQFGLLENAPFACALYLEPNEAAEEVKKRMTLAFRAHPDWLGHFTSFFIKKPPPEQEKLYMDVVNCECVKSLQLRLNADTNVKELVGFLGQQIDQNSRLLTDYEVNFLETTSYTKFREQFETIPASILQPPASNLPPALQGPHLKRNSVVQFTWNPKDNSLRTFLDGVQIGYLESPVLARSLFQGFLGPLCVSQRVRFYLTQRMREDEPLATDM